MYKGRPRLLPIALVVIVTIVAIIAMVSVGKALLNRDGTTDVVVDDAASRSLLAVEADRSVRMMVRGPIIADENFNSYLIEVSPIERRMTTFEGYGERVIDTVRLGNSVRAYEEFVHALDRVNFTTEEQLSEALDDIRGICAGGRLFTFEMLQAQSVEKQLWISNCRDIPASFGGNAVQARDLFLRQIPDSAIRLRGLNL